jgi:hypothetical protein
MARAKDPARKARRRTRSRTVAPPRAELPAAEAPDPVEPSFEKVHRFYAKRGIGNTWHVLLMSVLDGTVMDVRLVAIFAVVADADSYITEKNKEIAA